MAGDGFAKILDFEGTFEAGSEEAAERGDKGCEGCEDEDVELHRGYGKGEGCGVEEEWGSDGVGVGEENGVGVAVEAGEDARTEIVDRANEIFVTHENVSHCEAEEDGQDPSADEALDGLFGG